MTIYVGNVSHKATGEDLADLFSQYGEVSNAKIVTDKFTGRSRGFGFVDMDEEAGNNAINSLNGTEFMTRNITVNEAKPREEGASRPRFNNNRGGGGFNRGGNSGGGYNRERRNNY